ncbi:MAG: ATP-binding cassette domain-containing protein [Rhodospirillales bacterium]|nr:ATP-binding cassette domain-containing protein [Rhodospirillales bacterium]
MSASERPSQSSSEGTASSSLSHPLLSVRAISRPGLAPASLRVAHGQCVAIDGPSGAGKTLLLRAIADLDPNSGEVVLNGRPRHAIPAPDWRRQVGYIAAESGWWGESVGSHLADGDRIAPLLTELSLPADAGTWPIARLSTGERQRLALVRTLTRFPLVLLLDEPTSALDQATTERVENVLRRMLRNGVGIVLVTHDRDQIARLADLRLTMRAGTLTAADEGA